MSLLSQQFQIRKRTNSIKKIVMNFSTKLGTGETAETDPKPVQGLTSVVQTLLQQRQGRVRATSRQTFGRADEMSRRLHDLDKHIADLRTQAGVENWKGKTN